MLAIRNLILTRLVGDLLKQFGTITVCGERGYDPDAQSFTEVEPAVKEALQFDECHIFTSGNYEQGYGSYVYVIFGNGNCDLDLICDYTTDLEPIIHPINEWTDGIEKGTVALTTL